MFAFSFTLKDFLGIKQKIGGKLAWFKHEAKYTS